MLSSKDSMVLKPFIIYSMRLRYASYIPTDSVVIDVLANVPERRLGIDHGLVMLPDLPAGRFNPPSHSIMQDSCWEAVKSVEDWILGER